MASAHLQITIESASNLYNSDGILAGKSDPYVIVEVPGQEDMKFVTPVIANNLNPVWNFTGEIKGFMDGDVLRFTVMDSDTFPKPDQFLGKCALSAQDFYPQGLKAELALTESKTEATLKVIIAVLGNVAAPQTLSVNIVRARNLYNADGILAGKSDPYCICTVPGKKTSQFKTPTKNNSLEPEWQYAGKIYDFAACDSLEFQVWDSDTFPKPDQLLGKVLLSPHDFLKHPTGPAGEFPLTGGIGGDQGILELTVQGDGHAFVSGQAGGGFVAAGGASQVVSGGHLGMAAGAMGMAAGALGTAAGAGLIHEMGGQMQEPVTTSSVVMAGSTTMPVTMQVPIQPRFMLSAGPTEVPVYRTCVAVPLLYQQGAPALPRSPCMESQQWSSEQLKQIFPIGAPETFQPVHPEHCLYKIVEPRQQLAGGAADVAMLMHLSGPLLKRSPNTLMGWQLRWFEVGGGSVRYYSSPHEAKARAKPNGEISLAGLHVQRKSDSAFDFTVLQTGDRIFSLDADVGRRVGWAGWELGPAGVPTALQWVAALQYGAETVAEAKEEAER